jgi:hypothetical protein
VYGAEGNDKPFVPGDLITHWQDRKSQGFVVSVIDAQNVLVLWSRPPFFQTQNPCGEVPFSNPVIMSESDGYFAISYVSQPTDPSCMIKAH